MNASTPLAKKGRAFPLTRNAHGLAALATLGTSRRLNLPWVKSQEKRDAWHGKIWQTTPVQIGA